MSLRVSCAAIEYAMCAANVTLRIVTREPDVDWQYGVTSEKGNAHSIFQFNIVPIPVTGIYYLWLYTRKGLHQTL